jgi:hypothetical protein
MFSRTWRALSVGATVSILVLTPMSSAQWSQRGREPSTTDGSAVLANASADPQPTYLFGTLATDANVAAREYAAGLRLAHIDLAWNRYEPQSGEFDDDYIVSMRSTVEKLRAAGMGVVLSTGLQQPPAWVMDLDGSAYVDQYGVSSNVLNLTFSQRVRNSVRDYLSRVVQDFDPASFWAVRIGSGGNVESLYPDEQDSAGHVSAYWAFDANAQMGLDRPRSIPPSPYPGWKPGERTYGGQPFTETQVQQWFEWYVGALVDGINWQIATYKALGYTGEFQVLMPGLGTRPTEYRVAIADYLGGAGDANHTLGRAAIWNLVIDKLVDRQNVVIYVSSVADGSGKDDLCQPDDRSISLDNPTIDYWSATRWISYNADRYQMRKSGENPGQRDQPVLYGPGMLRAALRQVDACGLQSLMWAHDFNLYAPNPAITLTDYARAISNLPH